ncbi:pimeloyl-ACP methyl ester carboxylesterase [Actinoplanes lutulentus]|uniref:Serine hydrolase n=1 Tax=Actinoplanes lutulentus TaxID=1287878 RepID=A0A327ZF84_9ACTN|nr:alpha/beta hydrolase [Actinoplanes lutulentus]MBB2941694.1 pimeloyl-ACP methyl ester carboxylesterase [Actinoplanes lutulentus]RAK39614.1 serine hydrolase [Actinoplanes lutulentus]
MKSDLVRFEDWTDPVPPAAREVVSRLPEDDIGHPPLLFVPGTSSPSFAEHWLGHAAGRGFSSYALSPRPGGDLRAQVHDTVQVAASLPRQAVLIGHGLGALVVARALGRYPARAAVLTAPVLSGWAVARAFSLFSRPVLPAPAGDPPVLVAGSPDDRAVKRKALDRAAAGYGGAPLLFPGMGHDLMLEEGWEEPIDAILDWLEKQLPMPGH